MKLNKFILLIILGLFLPLASKAEVNVDIQAAPQLTTKFSFRAGVNVEIPLSDNLSLDPGLFYSMRHRQREEKIETTTQQGDIIDIKTCELNAIANYLQLPVYISYNIPTRDTDLQKIMVGPYFAYCIGGNSDITQRHNGEETSHETYPTYPLVLDSRFDFGLAMEYKYVLKSHFVFGMFVEFGLKRIFSSIDVHKDSNDWSSEPYHMNPGTKMNEAVGLSIGYRF